MPPKTKKGSAKLNGNKRTSQSRLPINNQINDDVEAVLAQRKRTGKKNIRDEMLPRYGIRTDKAFGVSMANMKVMAKRLGHEF